MSLSNKHFWYDLANHSIIEQKDFAKLMNAADLEIIEILIDETEAYYYKWSIDKHNINIVKDSGSIQAFVLSIERIILDLTGKQIPANIRIKLYTLIGA